MEWISVKDRLPENKTGNPHELTDDVLVYIKEGVVGICEYYPKDNKWFFDDIEFEVTHWMPLPEPPKV